MSRLLALSLLLPLACGETTPDDAFTACGGDLSGGWTLKSAALESNPDGCSGTTVGGFIVFNANGRFSLNGQVQGWKKPGNPACGFDVAYGGFYRTSGALVCMASTDAELAAFPCTSEGALGSGPVDSKAELCVDGTRLRLRSSSLLYLKAPAVLELERMQ